MDVVIEPSGSHEKLRVLSHRQYNASDALSPSTVRPDPLDQFRAWFAEAQGKVREPEAMALATVAPAPAPETSSGSSAPAVAIPSVRFVLLKTADTGFVFFTNSGSRKGRELAAPGARAALAFYWAEVHRQVRVVGRVAQVSRSESEEYFRSRPLGSRVGAWASPQSSAVEEGEVAERVREVRERFGVKEGEEATDDVDIPCPDFWGGWRVIPDEVEFWAGKPSRLHDRVRYTRVEDPENEWKIERLAP